MKRSNKKSLKSLDRVKPSQAIVAAKRNAKLKQTSKKQAEIIIMDIYESARECKEMIRGSTGVIFDRRMVEHHCLWDSNYPECPERFSRVLHRCEELGLLSRSTVLTSRTAEEYEVLYKHGERHIEILKATENCKDEDSLEKLSSKYDAIYIHPSTYQLSLLAAGCAIEIVDAVCRRKIHNGMAIVRPPGHHAMKNEYCGYCFFNNVALAAEHALNNCDISRIVIVDWDVHHGQATQQMFYDDPRVVYFSIHRYEHGSFWPNLRESDYDYIGEGKGRGYNFNVPLNKTGMTDADYLAIFHHVLIPVVLEFQPELILISAGYDAAIGCPEGEMKITPVCYAHLLSSLMCLASGKIVVVLEGGYCLKSLAEGAALTLRCLLGDPCPPLQSLPPPSDSITESILNVIYAHRDYWKSLQIQDVHKKLTDAEAEHSNPNNRIKEEKMTSAVVKLYQIPPILFLGSSEKPERYETRNCYPVQSEELFNELDATLNKLIVGTNLSFAPNRVCIVYDEVMMKHKNVSEPSHPEKPERISSIFLKHEEFGLLDRCLRLKARPVTDEELELLHSRDHIKKMQDIKSMNVKDILKLQDDFSSMYLHPETYESAAVAAGSILEVVDSVLNGDSQSGVAIVRPPGHHAEEAEPCGFCVFNNVALAAKYAVTMHGLKRVLILDWDVHHGNGTQHMFEEDPRVLYISLHRYDNGSFFPGSTDANYTEVGIGPGKGYNINIPWNKRGMGDGDYVTAFHQVVLPVCYQFNPELVLVSAGFDAAIGDPLGGCKVTPEAYGHMAHWLSSLANGKIILCLEGGYNITSISYAMALCTKALLGDPLPPLQAKLAPSQSAINTIRSVVKVQSNYWSCLRFGVSFLDQQYFTEQMNAVGDTDVVVGGCSQCKEEIAAQVPNGSSISLEDTLARINLREEVALHCSKPATSHITTKDNYLNDSNYFSSSGEDKSPDSPMDFSGTSSLISPISSPGDCNQSWSLSPPSSVTIPENGFNETVVNTQFSDKIEMDKRNKNVESKTSDHSLESDLGHDSNENPITEKHPNGIGDTEVSLRKMADNNTSSSGSNSQQAGASNSADGGDAAGSSATSDSSSRPRRLVDYLAENMQMLVAGEMFAVVPLPDCPHLDRVREVPPCGIDCTLPCLECGSTRENWICLECYTVHCGRYVNGHMVEHGMEMSHPITLSFSDISVWCYACEAYIENQVLYSAKNAVHRSKFGTEMPWSYND